MRVRWALWLVGGCCIPGCNLAGYIGQNAINESAAATGATRVRHELRTEAKAMWAACGNAILPAASLAYADGFVDGYVDQADNGGPPLPPAVPPPRYRQSANDQTAQGQSKAQDYLAGFYRGAQAAVETNRRQSLLVPLAIPVVPPEHSVQVVRPPVRLDSRAP